jgi:hypothetical protein
MQAIQKEKGVLKVGGEEEGGEDISSADPTQSNEPYIPGQGIIYSHSLSSEESFLILGK